ncbi:hypothetical protein [Gilliamella apicola]|uniref:hypothetical protein n=1 Tax=Gilliamella apicola TaxID=1196095 RepID=UPI000A7F214C|nr:hypothetical protein [Gilliamella apicola]
MSKIFSNLLIAISLLFAGSSLANNNPYHDSEIYTNESQLSNMQPIPQYDYVPVYP